MKKILKTLRKHTERGKTEQKNEPWGRTCLNKETYLGGTRYSRWKMENTGITQTKRKRKD